MLEHRKKARRKARSSSDCISVSPNRTKSCTDLIPKYSAASYTNIDGNVHSQNEAEHHAVSSPPINHIVIDSDTDESNFGTDCADEDGESYNSTNTIRCSSATGSYERTEIVESDTTRRIREFAGKYICPCCDYCAPYPSKVKRHIANQHSDSHVCAECDMRFNTFSVLRKHISSEHPKVHRCEFCSFSNKVKAAVRRHTILNHENGVICTVAGCNMRVSRWRLKAHIEKDHNCYKPVAASSVADSEACPTGIQTALLKCSHCGFDTNDLDDYNSHVMSAHEVGIVCPMPDCSARFLLGDMDSHFATLHNASTFEDSPIDACAASYATTTTTSECVSTSNCSDAACSELDGFNPPKNVHASQGSSGGLHCSLCGKDYRNLYLLRKHIRSVHERSYARYTRRLKYSCNWPRCKKVFTTSGLLEDHMNTHRGVKPYHCGSCGSSFHARARFAVHLSKYHKMSIRDYSCVSRLLKHPTSNNDSDA